MLVNVDKSLSGVTIATSQLTENKGDGMPKKANTRSFKPWEENRKRLEVAAESGLNVSEMINEFIRDNFKPYIEQKAKKLTQLASSN